jgi:type IV pilus assembly protein PilM
MPGSRSKVLGLDIGSSSIKWILYGGSEGPFLFDWGTIEIPPEWVKNGRIVNSEGIGMRLKEILRGINGKVSKVSLALSCPEMIVRAVPMPKLNSRELDKVVKYEVEQLLPVGTGKYIFDYSILGDIFIEGTKQVRVLITAVPSAVVEEYVTLFKSLGLTPYLFDFHGSCASKIVNLLQAGEKNDNRAVVDIGFSSTTITIVENGAPVFTRLLQSGSNDITRSIASSLNLTHKEAEQRKKACGGVLREQIKPKGDAACELVQSIMPPVEQLLKDVYRSAEFYRSTSGNNIDTIILAGGGSCLKGLDVYFASNLGIDSIPINEQTVELFGTGFPRSQAGKFINVLGLAVADNKGKMKKMNLLPEEYRDATRKNKMVKGAAIILAAAVLTGALLLPYHYIQGINARSLDLQNKLTGKDKIVEYRNRRDGLEQIAVGRQELADILKADSKQWSGIFGEIGRQTPGGTVLVSMDYNCHSELTLIGETSDYRTAAMFVVMLQNMEEILSAEPVSISLLENRVCLFEIRCIIRGEAGEH